MKNKIARYAAWIIATSLVLLMFFGENRTHYNESGGKYSTQIIKDALDGAGVSRKAKKLFTPFIWMGSLAFLLVMSWKLRIFFANKMIVIANWVFNWATNILKNINNQV